MFLALSAFTMRVEGKKLRNSRGFTLIELLLVVVIIGLIAAIAVPRYTNTKKQAYIAAMQSDLRNLSAAEETYFVDNLQYTTSVSILDFNESEFVTVSIPVGDVAGWRATATHQSTSVTCELYYGSASGASTATTEGVVDCSN